MALQKQSVPVLFNQGVNTKESKFTLQSGLLELENSYWISANSLSKRNGYRQYSTDITPTGAIASARKLAVFNSELVLLSNTNIYTYSSGSNKWISKGELIPCSVANESIMSNSYEQTSADSASANGISLFAWEDTRGGVRAATVPPKIK